VASDYALDTSGVRNFLPDCSAPNPLTTPGQTFPRTCAVLLLHTRDSSGHRSDLDVGDECLRCEPSSVGLLSRIGFCLLGKANLHPLAFYTIEFTSPPAVIAFERAHNLRIIDAENYEALTAHYGEK
jgi:hypothetical protein